MPTGVRGTYWVELDGVTFSFKTKQSADCFRKKNADKLMCVFCLCRAGHLHFEQPRPMLYDSLKKHINDQHLNHATAAVRVLSIRWYYLLEILAKRKTVEWRDTLFKLPYPALILLQMSKTDAHDDPRAGHVVAVCMIHKPSEHKDPAQRPFANYTLCYELTDLHVFDAPFVFPGQATAILPSNEQRPLVRDGVVQKANRLVGVSDAAVAGA